MNLLEEAKAVARAGTPADGVAFIERAADEGDPEGNLLVAHWLLYGSDRPRDAKAAHQRLALAAKKGNAHAARMRAYLTANGTGCVADEDKAIGKLREIAPSDPVAAEQLEFLPRMMGLADARDCERERLSSDPHIEIVRKLLTPEECAYLIRRAEPSLRPSHIHDPASDFGKADPIRTSHGAAFLPHDEDLVLQAINRRIAEATGTRVDHAEALYVMRYTPGQEYKPHLDALAGLTNQRAWTAIAYLNDDYDGGATVFPQLSIAVGASAGDLLIFSNLDANHEVDWRMRHGGEPVTRGVKWIATRWIRAAPVDPYDRG